MPSMSDGCRPASAIARREASTIRSRIGLDDRRTCSVLPTPAIAIISGFRVGHLRPMQVEEVLLYEKVGAVARITMNRPEKRNAQNLRMLQLLSGAGAAAAPPHAVRAIRPC